MYIHIYIYIYIYMYIYIYKMDGKIKLRQGTRSGIFKQIDTEVCL